MSDGNKFPRGTHRSCTWKRRKAMHAAKHGNACLTHDYKGDVRRLQGDDSPRACTSRRSSRRGWRMAPLDIDPHPIRVEDDQFDMNAISPRQAAEPPRPRGAGASRRLEDMHAKLLNRARPLWDSMFSKAERQRDRLYSKMHHRRHRWRRRRSAHQHDYDVSTVPRTVEPRRRRRRRKSARRPRRHRSNPARIPTRRSGPPRPLIAAAAAGASNCALGKERRRIFDHVRQCDVSDRKRV